MVSVLLKLDPNTPENLQVSNHLNCRMFLQVYVVTAMSVALQFIPIQWKMF